MSFVCPATDTLAAADARNI